MIAAMILQVGCSEPTAVSGIAGTYKATTYLAGPVGEPPADILALGVSWTLVIRPDGTGESTMSAENPLQKEQFQLPPTTQLGFVGFNGTTAYFTGFGSQAYLTERTWTVKGDTLVSSNEVVGGLSAIIRFARQ